jgi:alkanesulfonate monooxygenase SsuD/methylene tetrahydromethanopterin reductase-like flavin-dependent oxidoreductase (luciferase family)
VELGVQGLNAKATLGPAVTRRIARRAEELGYTSWWAGEHVVLPSPRTAGSPMDPRDPILDPLVHLSYVAACTETMELRRHASEAGTTPPFGTVLVAGDRAGQ